MRILFLLLALKRSTHRPKPRPSSKSSNQQQADWNRHDLEAFMSGYWNSPSLTFFSAQRKASGWQATTRSLTAKPTRVKANEMGKLEFSDLQIEELSPNAALVRGSWKLTLVRRQNTSRALHSESANLPTDGLSHLVSRR